MYLRPGRRTLILILALVLIGTAMRLALPTIVLTYVNKTLNQLPDYSGSVKDVDIALIRGAYVIKDFDLKKREGKLLQPFVSIKRSELSIEWRALFEGKLVGEIEMSSPAFNLVRGDSNEESQLSTKGDWQKMVGDLFPLTINRVGIKKGAITYRHKDSKDRESVSIRKIVGSIEHLSNKRTNKDLLPSSLSLQGILQGYAFTKVKGRLDPLAKTETFDLDVSVASLPLEKLNTFLKQSLFIDAQGGTFELYGEVACKEGKFKGYMKPILKDIKILSISQDGPNPLALVWEGIMSLVLEIFTNQRHNQFASIIPIEGKLSDPHVEFFEALHQILKNAYIRALELKTEDSIDIKDVSSP